MNLEDLKKPFPIEKISWRVGATNVRPDGTLAWGEVPMGIPLAFIDARDVMERFDEVCTPGKWQNKHPHANGKTSCAIGIKIDDEWVWKENGAGDSDVEGVKGAFSDSFKRSAVLWGVGRYLYDVPNIWIELERKGKTHVFKNPNDPKLEGILKKAERIALGEKVDMPSSIPEQKKKPFTETEMQILIQKLDECESSVDLENVRGLLTAAKDRMESGQKSTLTKKINEKTAVITNRELDKQAERQMA